MKRMLLVLSILSSLACSSPPDEAPGWRPVAAPVGVAPTASGTFVQLEARFLRVDAERADAWVGPDRHMLRVSHVPLVRVRQILREVRRTLRDQGDSSVVTVAPEQEARVEILTQRAYVQDYGLAPSGELVTVIGIAEEGLRLRLAPTVEAPVARLDDAHVGRQRIVLRGQLELVRLVELQRQAFEVAGQEEAEVELDIPQLTVVSHPLALSAQDRVTVLVAPPSEGQRQPLILLCATVISLDPEPRPPAAPRPGSGPSLAPGGGSPPPGAPGGGRR